jgi:hypothetical protein
MSIPLQPKRPHPAGLCERIFAREPEIATTQPVEQLT